ncbi:MAG: YceG family protein [Eubacteriales bacterium]
MFKHIKIKKTEDFFTEIKDREVSGVYFYRVNGWNEEVRKLIGRYYEAARRSGVVIEGRIPNPDEKNLNYYSEIMGMDFAMDRAFIETRLKKWLPRMNTYQCSTVAASIFDTLKGLQAAGKNENMLKNAYIKFMCWLYYKFERIVGRLGDNSVPKILYEGSVSSYELLFLSILSGAGCDILLLQYKGDAAYLKLDPRSEKSDVLELAGMSSFPAEFSLKTVRDGLRAEEEKRRLYGEDPALLPCTNAWMKGDTLEDIRKPCMTRGEDAKFFYNAFARITGAWDKLTYVNDLYMFYQELRSYERTVCVVENEIPIPTSEEIGTLNRKNYANYEQMLGDLAGALKKIANKDLAVIARHAFLDLLFEESAKEGMNLNRLTNRAIYVLCWFLRWQKELFRTGNIRECPLFIYLGGCRNEQEALFIRFLSRLPADVLILVPNLSSPCVLEDPLLYEQKYDVSLRVTAFPKDSARVQVGTTAYHAERELDTMLYQGSGIYRNQQYQKENSIILQTMYEEIPILWKEEVSYREHFSTTDELVNIPVIFSKVSGVKDGDVARYWNDIRILAQEDCFIAYKAPLIDPTVRNPMLAYATEFFRNGKLMRDKIRNHAAYPYGVLRADMQEHLMDKTELLINEKWIRGTFENGTEYTIVATAMNLPKRIVRMIQKFDFTKKNPKMIYVNTKEMQNSKEDAIMAALLCMIGFDVLFFVPTGYQCVEQHYTKKILEEHQIGEYVYDLDTPDLSAPPVKQKASFMDRLLGRV